MAQVSISVQTGVPSTQQTVGRHQSSFLLSLSMTLPLSRHRMWHCRNQ